MSIYVSGPITGIPNDNREEFVRVKKELEAAGHKVTIPHSFILKGVSWQDAMRECIHELTKYTYYVEGVSGGWKSRYDGIALLDGWENSRGACLEKQVAEACGIKCKPWREWL